MADPSDHVALFVVLEPRRRPAIEAHAEHQAMALQHFLDLGERLLAEVRRTQQLHLGTLYQVADVVDVFGLEAVGTAHGEFQLVHGTQQDRIELHLGDLGRRLLLALQIDEHRQLVLEDAAGAADRLFRIDRAVGFDVDHQLVEVGTLLDARRIDRIGDAPHRRKRGIELQTPDRARLLLECEARGGRTIAAAALDAQRHGQLPGLGEIRDHQLGVHHLDIVIDLDVTGGDRTRALLVEPQLRGIPRVHAQCHGLEVEQNIDHVFLHTLDARVLVQHPVDFDLGDGTAWHGGQQHPTQRVAERVAKAPLERLDHHACLTRSDRLHLHHTRSQKLAHRTLHCSLTLPAQWAGAIETRADPLKWGRKRPDSSGCDHFEYSSTTRFSLMSGRMSSRPGADLNTPRNSLSFTSTHSGRPTCCATLSAEAMRSCLRDFSRTCTMSPGFTWKEAMVTGCSFTVIALWLTSWRASARVAAKPMRYTTLSSRHSRSRSRFSPVAPALRAASS